MIANEKLFQEELYLIPDKTTIILTIPWKQLGEDEQLQLRKILSAVKLSLESVAIIHQSVLDLSAFKSRPGLMLYFGDPVKGLSQYELLTIDMKSIIMAAPLRLLQGDQPARQKLWEVLKKVFGL